jgi:MFS family permease
MQLATTVSVADESELRRNRLREIFDEIDTDGDGLLDREEIAQLAKRMDRPLSSAELDAALAELDPRRTGHVTFEQFAVWYTVKHDAPGKHDAFVELLEHEVELSYFQMAVKMRAPLASSGAEWTGLSMIIPVMAFFVLDGGWSAEWVGLILTGQYLAGMLGSAPMGLLTDKMGAKRTLILILCVNMVAHTVSGLVSTVEQLMVVRCVAGFFNPAAPTSTWLIHSITEAQRPRVYGMLGFCITATILIATMISGPIFLLGGFPLVMFTAAALSAFALGCVISSEEPDSGDTAGKFSWGDVRTVCATREWMLVAATYLLYGIYIGFSMVFSGLLLVGEYGFTPWEISLVSWPRGVITIIAIGWVGPKLLLHLGPRSAFCHLTVLIALCSLASINFAGVYDDMFLVKVLALQSLSTFPQSIMMPSLSCVSARVIEKYGTRKIVGTVSGLTRMLLVLGQGVGPLLGAHLYTMDRTHLRAYFGADMATMVAVAVFGNFVNHTRPWLLVPIEGSPGEKKAARNSVAAAHSRASSPDEMGAADVLRLVAAMSIALFVPLVLYWTWN